MSHYLVITVLSFVIIFLLLWQWRHQRKLSLRVRLIREALRNRDFMFRLPTKRMLPGDRDLHLALNEMFGEINRLLARNEVESWQRLTRVLTHEIMNAMTPISSITQVYIGSQLVKGTPLEEGMRAIYDTSLSLQTFVDSYRKLTQLQPAHIEEVALDDLLSTVCMLYQNVEWHVDLGNEKIKVRADSGLARQVLVNIVKNAIEAGARNIDVRIVFDVDSAQLLVSNDAQPIQPEVAREIFVPFFTTKSLGSGIGLPLARQMMLAQDGNLNLAETPVAGYHTTFVVSLKSCQGFQQNAF